jgi:class 3 adenylate cyclase
VQQAYESDVHDIMRLIRVPTLVIARAWDDPEEDEYVAALIQNAQLRRLPGCDWVIWVGDQASVVDAIHEFLDARLPASRSEGVLATVLFTDIVDSTRLAAELGDTGWRDLLERHHAVVRTALSEHRGAEVDTAGDGFFATFEGPARAIRCAQQIVDDVGALGVQVRAGIHTGECVTIDGKVGGIAVAIGARVGAAASPDEVLVSQTVKDLVAGSGIQFESRGQHELKGVPDPLPLFRAVPLDASSIRR